MFKTTYLVEMKEVSLTFKFINGCHSPLSSSIYILAGDSDRRQYDDPSDRIWSIYVSEARKYDQVLASGWKSDMDGILIFVSTRLHSHRCPTQRIARLIGRFILGQCNCLHSRRL